MTPAHPEFTEYRVTFGQQYHHERHPRFPAAHPDGWLTVFAREEITARVAVIDRIGRGWSSVYEPADDWYPTTEHYPRGELGRMVARLVVTGPATDAEIDDARRAGPHALGCPALDEDPDGIEQCECEPAQVTGVNGPGKHQSADRLTAALETVGQLIGFVDALIERDQERKRTAAPRHAPDCVALSQPDRPCDYPCPRGTS